MKWTTFTRIRKGEKVSPEEYRLSCIDSGKDCLLAYYKHRSEQKEECDIMLRIAEAYLKEAKKPDRDIKQLIKWVGNPKLKTTLLYDLPQMQQHT